MFIVLHEQKEYEDPSTIVDVLELQSIQQFKRLEALKYTPDFPKLVDKMISQGKVKRILFKDMLVFCNYPEKA